MLLLKFYDFKIFVIFFVTEDLRNSRKSKNIFQIFQNFGCVKNILNENIFEEY